MGVVNSHFVMEERNRSSNYECLKQNVMMSDIVATVKYEATIMRKNQFTMCNL